MKAAALSANVISVIKKIAIIIIVLIYSEFTID